MLSVCSTVHIYYNWQCLCGCRMMSDEEKFRIIRQNKRILKEQKEAYSLWCTELYRLSIANKVFLQQLELLLLYFLAPALFIDI